MRRVLQDPELDQDDIIMAIQKAMGNESGELMTVLLSDHRAQNLGHFLLGLVYMEHMYNDWNISKKAMKALLQSKHIDLSLIANDKLRDMISFYIL